MPARADSEAAYYAWSPAGSALADRNDLGRGGQRAFAYALLDNAPNVRLKQLWRHGIRRLPPLCDNMMTLGGLPLHQRELFSGLRAFRGLNLRRVLHAQLSELLVELAHRLRSPG